MSDKQTSYTPIVVGVVIALIGILTGLYIADNAWQQLARSETTTEDAIEGQQPVQAEDDMPAPALELEPLAPVVGDHVVAETEELPDVPEVESSSIPVEEHIQPLPEEKDDFEEVPLQEIEQAEAHQQADSL